MDAFKEAQILEEFKIDRDEVDRDRRASVFNSQFLHQWFLQRGYTLYSAWKMEEDDDGECRGFIPRMSSTSNNNVCFPYAFHGGDDSIDRKAFPPLIASFYVRVLFAQDEQKRHVAIKIVKAASHEGDILRFLRERGTPSSEEEFDNVIPVLDILPFGEFCFVVMPRWGSEFDRPIGPTLKEVFDVLRNGLKGLAFLHKNRIAHGDISNSNILINHFCRHYNEHQNPNRQLMRRQGLLTYALFDFDVSVKFPLSWSDEQCRLPYRKSWDGTPGSIPDDTSQGEFDYDPFARDVAAMGMVFCTFYDHLTVYAPMLAPFFDKMLTRNISKRCTAQEALSFLEDEVYPRTSLAQMNQRIPEQIPNDRRNRWDGLDPAFLKDWAEYREPPLPITTKFLRFICRYVWVLHTIAFIRKNMHRTRQELYDTHL
ncbi:hypothetical protein H0H93_006418 [Arthromyces matolae]|nr:hypothetical protein H0H93_006418 [Arthromyces matolae]